MSSEEKKSTENLESDLVIVGGGGAGMAAALTATEKGCSNVIVVEKAGSPGGNSAMAHDLFGAESPVQIQMGTDARRDHFFQVAMQWSHWSKVNPRIVRAFIDKSGDTIRWLMEKGIKFELGQYYINQSPRIRHCIEGRGAELMKVLTRLCKERGVKIITHARGNKIIRGKDGRVTGIMAKSGDTEYVINAKCVIMATGGYAGNKEMLQKYCSYYHPDSVDNTGVPGNTGDGILMAIEVGAATAALGHVMFRGPMESTKSNIFLKIGEYGYKVGVGYLVWEPQIMWVNKKGRRFIDEGFNLSSFAPANAVAQQPDGIMYALFDDGILQSIEEKGFIRQAAYGGQQDPLNKKILSGMPVPGLKKALQEKAETDTTIKISDSLDEIACWIGTKPETLKASITEYNTSCQNGLDTIFCKDRRWLLPLQKPPYYAIKGQANLCDAIGGFKINERMEVMDTEDEPIPGLFAAGSTTGCWESEIYCYELTGHLLGFAINSGRIAAENAIKYIANK